jgi:hypothetical protein
MIHAVFVLAQYRAALTVGDRTEVHARFTDASALASSKATGPVFDLSTAPNAAVLLDNRHFAHSLQYSPRLTLRGDAAPGGNPELLQSGTLRSTWRARHVSLALTESAAYGARNFGDLATQTTTPTAAPGPGVQVGSEPGRPLVPLQLLPTTRSISYGSTTTTLSSIVVPDRRWTLSTSAAYAMSGGTKHIGQLFLPVQSSGIFDASLAYALTRSDRILTSVSPSVTAIPKAICEIQPAPTVPPRAPLTCNRDLQFLDVGEGWSKRWTRHTTTTVLGGTSVRRIRLDRGVPFRMTVGPLVVAELTHRLERTVLGATGRVGTVVDQRTGIPETRVNLGTLADWRHFLYAVHGSVQYSQSLAASRVNTVHVVYGEASVTRRLSSRFDAEAGGRLTWQESQGSSQALSNVYAAIVYHEPRILF